jgi:hypothetical protein
MVIRREHRRRLAAARACEATGDFEAARRALEPIALESRAAARVLRRLALLLGDYERAADDPVTRALVAYRTGEYAAARGLRGELPIVRLMQAFGAAPYRIEGESAVLPFTQVEPWDLPTVAIEVDGLPVEAWVDTGGDLLTLPHDFGVEPLATFRGGTYAGGAVGDGAYGKVGSVRLGAITVRDVPVATAGFEKPVIGTGFLGRFQPTIDYPGRRLVLRPRGASPPAGVEVPFALARPIS